MLSTLSASDPLLGNPFSTFDGGYTPLDCSDFFSTFKPEKPNTTSCSGSGSEDPNQNSDKAKHDCEVPAIIDERKRRRMISNRESARRSRMRKQKHVENLRNQVTRFSIENRELNNRLQFLLHHCNRVRTENEWLRSERTVLQQKLNNISQILGFQQLQPFSSAWPCSSLPLA